jgi:threonine/homoserine/homoserine lactone efflux protein
VSHLLAFIAVALVVNLTPGPAMLHCVASGAAGGRIAAVKAALGVELGVLAYVVATVTGLSALLVSAPPVYLAVQVAGACYLLYMAWGEIPRREREPGEDAAAQVAPVARPFVRGFLLNISNPKIALFFLTILPQLVPSGAGPWQLLLYGLGFNLSGLAVNATAGFLGHSLAPLAKRLGPVSRVLPWIPPVVFALLAVFTVVEVIGRA